MLPHSTDVVTGTTGETTHTHNDKCLYLRCTQSVNLTKQIVKDLVRKSTSPEMRRLDRTPVLA